jgi:hypothetical protein
VADVRHAAARNHHHVSEATERATDEATMIVVELLCLVGIVLLALALGAYEHKRQRERRRMRKLDAALYSAFERGEVRVTT